jgi:hypothetical protein
MAENRRSKTASYEVIGEYWDTHEVTDENSEPVELEIDLPRPTTYFPVEKKLADQLKIAAAAEGIASQALLDRWVRQKIAETAK